MRRFATETDRVEAFSDGVFAVIITIMVLELRPPNGTSLGALSQTLPALGTYALSFAFIGIYWNNHHHMLHAVQHVHGGILWANLHLLFWLSLFPFVTGWMGQNYLAALPTAFYGGVLLMAAIAYLILEKLMIAAEGPDSLLARAVGSEIKGRVSLVLYALGIAVAFYSRLAAQLLYVTVALMWLVPDRRIEREIRNRERS